MTFYSPGTFIAEDTTKPIASWDVDAAVAMASTIIERHGAVPYGFKFTTRERADEDLDSVVVEQSGIYYLGGRIETLEDVESRNDPEERILLSNMKGNGWHRIVVNDNSWRWTMPLREGDVVLDVAIVKRRLVP